MTREDIIRMAREAEDYVDTIYQKGEYHPGWLEVFNVRFAALVATAEKQKVVEYMNSRAFATGHGDTIEDLLKEMEWQVAEREREACAKLCEDGPLPKESTTLTHIPTLVRCATAIRARGES
jgi:UDP-2,3-diacylglucosamine pyrophosphatase LpxH